ncbi:hypothetical protein Pcar_3173 [Syntrophotalea carbinolica DSM 2380]|uniref:Uncharacterized protein n=1 Tax=Syntrophotalea carbinolica (strain DSM 2380 / NBRC 103641 / GraBd1) TaxID=338963 RepID=Q0C6Z4_SYNC1|nr:hypothetical protein Pcar_3173 [Syntrophotalea carbinolica DSM 2380]
MVYAFGLGVIGISNLNASSVYGLSFKNRTACFLFPLRLRFPAKSRSLRRKPKSIKTKHG